MSGWSAKTSAFLAGALHTYIVCSAYCCLYRCAHCKLVQNVASTLHSLKTIKCRGSVNTPFTDSGQSFWV